MVARHEASLRGRLLGLGLGRRRRRHVGRLVLVAAPPARRLGLVWRKIRVPEAQLEDISVELAVDALGVGDLVVVLDLNRPSGRL
eukprot:4412240-Prymnesium_polylepis.1